MAREAKFQRRHYEKIAEIIRTIECEIDRERVARRFASELRGTNPKFDRDRFVTAATREARR